MLVQDTAKNVGGVFYETQCSYIVSYRNEVANLLMTSSWTSSSEMAESQGDSTTSASGNVAAAAALEGATGWYQVEFIDQNIVNNSKNKTFMPKLYTLNRTFELYRQIFKHCSKNTSRIFTAFRAAFRSTSMDCFTWFAYYCLLLPFLLLNSHMFWHILPT